MSFEALLVYDSPQTANDFYILTTPLSLAVFLFFAQRPSMFSKTPLSRWGRRYSLGVYIAHSAVKDVCHTLFGAEWARLWPFGALFVFLLTLGLVMLYARGKKLFLKKFEKKLAFSEKV
jgi:hypothetical protein